MKPQNINILFVISGIEPSKKGAGKFLSYFIEILKCHNNNIELIFIRTPDNSIIKLLKKIKLSNHLKELYYKINRKSISKNGIHDSTILIFHPQSLGLQNTIDLIENNKKIFFYVLDNFFYCKKSYNHLLNSNQACNLCINDSSQSIIHNCLVFPNYYSHNQYLLFINNLESNLDKIVFLTQNDSQAQLLRRKFGNKVIFRKTGMFTGEFDINTLPKRQDLFEFDFIYHNTLSEAKGLKYFAGLCQHLPNKKFVIPYNRIQVEEVIGKIECSNIIFLPCTWDSGLLNLVLKTRIVIVPSLWSAPIEGSLLKSLYYGNTVALIPQEFSFNSELPLDIFLTLPNDIGLAALTLSAAINMNVSLNEKAVNWLNCFINFNIDLLHSFSKELSEQNYILQANIPPNN